MKKVAIVLLSICVLLCGCAEEPQKISIPDAFEADLTVEFKGVSFNVSMIRTLPHIYHFTMTDDSFYNAVIDMKSELFSLYIDGLEYENGEIPKSSFFYMLSAVLDYFSEPEFSVQYGELQGNLLELYGNNGYEDFIMLYDVSLKMPVKIEVESAGLVVTFEYT